MKNMAARKVIKSPFVYRRAVTLLVDVVALDNSNYNNGNEEECDDDPVAAGSVLIMKELSNTCNRFTKSN
jgi:hypothetical protein